MPLPTYVAENQVVESQNVKFTRGQFYKRIFAPTGKICTYGKICA
jgi:hypothetical protein